MKEGGATRKGGALFVCAKRITLMRCNAIALLTNLRYMLVIETEHPHGDDK